MIDAAEGSTTNLMNLLLMADATDRAEGALAYTRYHNMMRQMAELYDADFERTVAAFAALSPNNDYLGNLRSLATVLDANRRHIPPERVTVSTYGHCRDRAMKYLSGEAVFLDTVKGQKIRAFYRNIVDPQDPEPVTIDGHMVAAWMGQELTMKEAIIRPRQYEHVADGVRRLAKLTGQIGNQLQATVWFVRKRVLKVRYDPQVGLFDWLDDNVWRTLVPLEELRPYPEKKE